MLLDWIAQRIMDRYPALIAAGRWSLWFFIAFVASVALDCHAMEAAVDTRFYFGHMLGVCARRFTTVGAAI